MSLASPWTMSSSSQMDAPIKFMVMSFLLFWADLSEGFVQQESNIRYGS